MSLPAEEPNYELAIALLAGGNDVRALRRFAKFANLRQAREFARSPEAKAAVAERIRERMARVGAMSLDRLEQLLSDKSTDGRTVIAAARTGLEVAGYIRKDSTLPTKRVAELTVPELDELIAQTKRELEARKPLPVN